MLALLSIIIIAFGLILGFFTKEQAFRKLGRVLLIVALMPVFIDIGKNHFNQLPLEQKVILSIIVLTGVLLMILRILLGSDIFKNVISNFIYDGLKFICTLPIRVISSIINRYK
jgi:hypothetical protein